MAADSSPFPERRDQRIRVGRLMLHVTDWGGHTTDDAIVLAHPTGFLGAVWRPLLARLRALGVTSRLVTYDQRGHGLSSKPDDDYSWEHFLTDAVELLRAMGIRNALGVGHSAGATTLAGVAAAAPGLLRRVVMIDPVLFHPELARLMREIDENPMAARTRTRRVVWGSREELFRSYRGREPYDTWTDEALHAYVDEGTFERPDGEIELLCPARIEAQVYSAAAGFDGFAKVAEAGVPLLFVRGERSTTFDEERARRAVEVARNGRLVTVPETTHFVPMEKPDEVARLVVAEHRAEA
ncbi:MAG TPA: alpha/beta hydrolase [Candidatus Limnocylindrales bacterium]|nr:alpha/beta hydrolase [Candidatus Limnocylindrales bacterium]